MRVAPGATSRIAASTRSIVRAISSVERSSLKRTSATTRTSSGPRCMVSSSIRSSTAVDARAIASSIRLRDLRVDAPRRSAARRSRARAGRRPTSRISPMTIEAAASKAGLAGRSWRARCPRAATSRPLIAAVSSARTVSTSGSLELRSAARDAAAAPARVELLPRGAPGVALEADRDGRSRSARSSRSGSSWPETSPWTPCQIEKPPPTVNRLTATIRAQKKRAFPCPNGCSSSGGAPSA